MAGRRWLSTLRLSGRSTLRLAETATRLVANFSAHVLPQLGLTFDWLSERNERFAVVRCLRSARSGLTPARSATARSSNRWGACPTPAGRSPLFDQHTNEVLSLMTRQMSDDCALGD